MSSSSAGIRTRNLGFVDLRDNPFHYGAGDVVVRGSGIEPLTSSASGKRSASELTPPVFIGSEMKVPV